MEVVRGEIDLTVFNKPPLCLVSVMPWNLLIYRYKGISRRGDVAADTFAFYKSMSGFSKFVIAGVGNFGTGIIKELAAQPNVAITVLTREDSVSHQDVVSS